MKLPQLRTASPEGIMVERCPYTSESRRDDWWNLRERHRSGIIVLLNIKASEFSKIKFAYFDYESF